MCGPTSVRDFIAAGTELRYLSGLGWAALGVLELTSLPTIGAERWVPWLRAADVLLDAGPAPAYVGFGSMGGSGGLERTKVILEALEKSGQRGLIASGWGGMKASELPPSVFMLESVPHDWLFPKVSVVVHHGGSGTTAAGLRAGKPTGICPFLGDQPFWGQLVYERGVGPQPIPQGKLTAARLAEAICIATQDTEMRGRAAALGQKICEEDGVARAVEVVNEILGA